MFFLLQDSVRHLLSKYLCRFSGLTGPAVTCGPVLNWLELDNRGRSLIGHNDEANANANGLEARRPYVRHAHEEINLQVRRERVLPSLTHPDSYSCSVFGPKI
jgi:hypothetical protein